MQHYPEIELEEEVQGGLGFMLQIIDAMETGLTLTDDQALVLAVAIACDQETSEQE